MNYQQTIDYLYTQLPVFTRVGASAYKEDLTNTRALCSLLNNPQHRFKSIHIGGTNGKGSTSHMLAAILQTAGYKTGLYTSPHLTDFRERIRINGQMISEQIVIDFVAVHQADFEAIQPSFFEMTVALAFDVFSKEKVDIAVVEVGLGGRLDSTNVINPLLSIITNIGWDHMNILGDTLPKIAAEKAGIIKPDIPVIIGEYQQEVAPVFIEKARQQNAPVTFASAVKSIDSQKLTNAPSQLLNVTITNTPTTHNPNLISSSPATYDPQPTTSPLATRNPQREPQTLQLDLTGTYQVKNLKTVLTAADELRSQGFNLTDEHIKTALKQVKTLTGLRGRWEVLSNSPLTICDTGHNPEGVREVLNNIATVTYNQLHFVIGMVNDKDIGKVLSLLPANALYYFCKPDIPRGLDAENLRQQAANFGLNGNVYASVKDALQAAQQTAQNNDLVFVGGSTFVVAEVV